MGNENRLPEQTGCCGLSIPGCGSLLPATSTKEYRLTPAAVLVFKGPRFLHGFRQLRLKAAVRGWPAATLVGVLLGSFSLTTVLEIGFLLCFNCT